MTTKSSKPSLKELKAYKLQLRPKKGGMLEFILKNCKKNGPPVDALEMTRKYCGRG